jgi:parallel beta-helix repeat protein
MGSALAILPAPVFANPGCGATITSDTTLTGGIGPCPGYGLIIGASGITLNCAGYRIGASSPGKSGIDLYGVSHVTVENCDVAVFSYGFNLTRSSHNILNGDTANNIDDGFYLYGSSSNLLANSVANSDEVGFYLTTSSNNNTLAVNTAKDSNDGFLLSTSSDSNTFILNTADDNWYGFYLNSNCNNNIFTSNTANGNEAYGGFTLIFSSHNTFTKNTAIGDTVSSYGFSLWGASDSNTFTSNTANNNTQDGFYIYGYPGSAVGVNNTFTSNTANYNLQSGFYISNSSSFGNTFSKNTANNNNEYGYVDLTTGSGTAGTADLYAFDVCYGNYYWGSGPDGLCPTFISLSPSSGPVGTSVTITGANFYSNTGLGVMYDESTLSWKSCTTNSTGVINSGCTFTVPSSSVGPHTVTVYDDSHSPTATFTVVLSVATSTTPLSNGNVTINQPTTGADVTINGSTAANGTNVTLTSQVWGTTQPPGTGSVTLSSAFFFDVQITGITTGTADVCITNATIKSAEVMQYWYGEAWVNATQITWIKGTGEVTVCGDIPVSALNGTPIVVGGGHAQGEWIVSVATTLSLSKITAGGSVKDSATLTGATGSAGGTVKYEFFSGGTCSGTATQVGSKVTVTNGVAPSSTPQTFNTAGRYSWNAFYSGDTSNMKATSPCESLTVNPALIRPTISVMPLAIGKGQFAKLSVKTPFKGGTSPYNCQWLKKSPTATSFTALGSSFTSGCAPSLKPSRSTGALTTLGTWTFELQVKDAAGAKAVSSPVKLTVKSLTHVTIACTKSTIAIGAKMTCTATVTGSYSSHTGGITWTKASGKGGVTFSSKTCTLVKGKCSVTVKGTGAGSVTIKATYSGDTHNLGSSGTIVRTIT